MTRKLHLHSPSRIGAMIVAVLAIFGVTVLTPQVAQAATAPTHLWGSQVTNGRYLISQAVVATPGPLVISWETKEGQGVTPVVPTLNTQEPVAVLQNARYVYDDSGTTRGEVGVIVLDCGTTNCNYLSLSFPDQLQTHSAWSLDQFPAGSTIGTVAFAGSANNGSGGTPFLSSFAPGDILFAGGAHQANEATIPSFATATGGNAAGTVTTLASLYGAGNGSLGVGWESGADAYNAATGGAYWNAFVPGAGFSLVVS